MADHLEATSRSLVPSIAPSELDGTHGDMGLELEARENRVKELEFQVNQKEAEVRRAREEHALIRELHAVNMVALRKVENDTSRANKLLISPESLAEVIALEDQIKIETKKTDELNREAALLEEQMGRTQKSIDDTNHHIDLVKERTGWERHNYASTGFVNEENRHLEHQKRLAELQREQETMKKLTLQIGDRLEQLTVELEARKDVEAELVEAQVTLKSLATEYNDAIDQKKSMERISHRKELMLDKMAKTDDYKTVRLLEGDKKVLHLELNRSMEQIQINEKSVQAQDLKLHQLETRLAAVNQFLQSTFSDLQDSESFRPGVEEAAAVVTTFQFDDVQQQLANARYTLRDRDRQLEGLDAKIETLEQKVNIMHIAHVSRTAITAQEYQELEQEAAMLRQHIDQIQNEFEREFQRLSDEQSRLQEIKQRLTK